MTDTIAPSPHDSSAPATLSPDPAPPVAPYPARPATETRLRHTALIIAAIEALVAYGFLSLLFIGMSYPYIRMPGGSIPPEVIWLNAAGLAVGVVIILAAWRPVFFHILSLAMIVFVIVCAASTGLSPGYLFVWLLLLVAVIPQIVYYGFRLNERRRTHPKPSSAPFN